MININLSIHNPWSIFRFKTLCWKTWGTPFKNKVVELRFVRDDSILVLELNYSIRQDHSGLCLELGLFGYSVNFQILDRRQWNYVNKCYEEYPENPHLED
jgi:hypothetical protein